MTQEEKARAYDEALKKAKQFHDKDLFAECNGNLVEYIFPELAESEDERIRKKLIKYFQDLKGGWFGNISHDDILAWLEKQGKPKWSEEDEKCIDNCCLLIVAADNCYEKTFKDYCIHYLQNLKQRMEQ